MNNHFLLFLAGELPAAVAEKAANRKHSYLPWLLAVCILCFSSSCAKSVYSKLDMMSWVLSIFSCVLLRPTPTSNVV